ncbi:MarR family winged helix-turn-helix transcriptional regulator [Planosporangium sp. 12N6]|uniref:MarR family winged helix-turn-helix transcriptional regulator n=1 Tax=Planosporangium spinosum TaxID=3402278 RepID=UPI003CF785C4
MDDAAVAAGVVDVAPQLHRALERRADADFAHPKPPEVQLAVLRLLQERPGVMVREVAHELQLKPNNASALVSAMVAAGMVRKEQDQRDRRVVHLYVTDEARGRAEAVQALFTGYVAAALDALEPVQREAIRAALPALGALAREIRAAGR